MSPRDPIIALPYKEMLATLCAHATDAYAQLYNIPRDMVAEYVGMSGELARKVMGI